MQAKHTEINWSWTVHGHGDPVLFLHGGLDACANYTRFLEELSATFQVVALDRRGHGKTADTNAPFDYALMAQEIAGFTRDQGLPPFHIVGFSDGANIGLHMASLFPKAVRSLIAISGNYTGRSGMSDGWVAMIEALSVDFVQKTMPEVLEQYLGLNPAPDPETLIAKTRALWSQETVIDRDRLTTLQVPTLVVGGDRDIVLPEQLVEMNRLVPGSSLLMLPYCGHFVFQDFAWSETASFACGIFREFLETGFSGHNRDFI